MDDVYRHRYGEVVQYLLEKGVSTGSIDQTVNLITAAVTGYPNKLQIILSQSASLPPQIATINTPLAHTTIDINN